MWNVACARQDQLEDLTSITPRAHRQLSGSSACCLNAIIAMSKDTSRQSFDVLLLPTPVFFCLIF